MNKLLITVLTITLITSSFQAAKANPGLNSPLTTKLHEVSEDEVIIKYKKVSTLTPKTESEDTVSEDQFLNEFGQGRKFRKLARHKKKRISRTSKFAVVKLDKKLKKDSIKSLVKKLNGKKFKNTNYEVEAVFANNLYEISGSTSDYTTIVNDPLAYQQLSLKQLDPQQLWQYTKGEDAVVAVIDTGVDYNHEDLKDNIWNNVDEIAGNGIDDDKNGYVDDTRGWDFVDNAGFNCISSEDCNGEDNNPMDVNTHGTHVSGIIAANQNNNVGISGIAPKAKIMPLRAGYSTGASAFLSTSDIIQAITYAIDNDADVINMSFAGAELDVLDDILDLADSVGIVLVAAAGNNGSSTPTYPAALPQVIAVGSIADNDTKSSFSNYGTWVDIVAPGSWIMSTTPGNQYGIKSGTSMASPHVAGIAALIKSKNKLRKLSSAETRSLIMSSTYPTTFFIYPGSPEKVGGVSANVKFTLGVDSITMPAQALTTELVSVTGSGSDYDSEIVGYEWSSDVDGYLGSDKNITLSNLALGTHTISLKVQNANGEWSSPAYKALTVRETRSTGTFNLADTIKYKFAKNKSTFFVQAGSKNLREIKAYKWVSSKDGNVSNSRSLAKYSLSRGYHKLSLMIQDKEGNWSKPLERVVLI